MWRMTRLYDAQFQQSLKTLAGGLPLYQVEIVAQPARVDANAPMTAAASRDQDNDDDDDQDQDDRAEYQQIEALLHTSPHNDDGGGGGANAAHAATSAPKAATASGAAAGSSGKKYSIYFAPSDVEARKPTRAPAVGNHTPAATEASSIDEADDEGSDDQKATASSLLSLIEQESASVSTHTADKEARATFHAARQAAAVEKATAADAAAEAEAAKAAAAAAAVAEKQRAQRRVSERQRALERQRIRKQQRREERLARQQQRMRQMEAARAEQKRAATRAAAERRAALLARRAHDRHFARHVQLGELRETRHHAPPAARGKQDESGDE